MKIKQRKGCKNEENGSHFQKFLIVNQIFLSSTIANENKTAWKYEY